MKKEHFLVTAIGLFIISYAIDYFAGPVNVTAKNPFTFVSAHTFSAYPFTALAVGLRTLGIVTSIVLTLSLMEKNYFAKSGISLFMAIAFFFYSIQQLATGGKTTPIQWTLSFAYSGMLLAPVVIFYFLTGIFSSIHSGFAKVSGSNQENNLETNDVEEPKS
jgi:hypothetical protein